MKSERLRPSLEQFAHRSFHLGAALFQQRPSIDLVKRPQLRQACGHGERISRQCPSLIDRPVRRKPVHDIGATAKCAHRQAASDDFSQRSQVGLNSVKTLSAAARDAKAGHDFIKDEQRAVARAFLAQEGEEFVSRKIQSGVRRYRLENNGGNFFRIFAKHASDGFDIIERNRNCEIRERFGNAGAVGLAVRQTAAAGFHEERIDVAVVAAVELDDLGASRETAGKAQTRHRRLGAAVDHPNLFEGRHPLAEKVCHFYFERIGRSKAQTLCTEQPL